MRSFDLTYWACPNGHVVLDHHMPHSGTVCNVAGCAGERTQRVVQVDDVIHEANEMLGILWEHNYEPEAEERGIDGPFVVMARLELLVERGVRRAAGLDTPANVVDSIPTKET